MRVNRGGTRDIDFLTIGNAESMDSFVGGLDYILDEYPDSLRFERVSVLRNLYIASGQVEKFVKLKP